ncbi:hypothetical protein HG531_003344 [Fusarium graminearum]|nr:hypothetical protein HG531_003344 [Fusarium graminearum]
MFSAEPSQAAGHLVKLHLLFFCQHVVPLLEVGGVFLAATDEELGEVGGGGGGGLRIPLGHDNLQATFAVDLNLTQKVDHLVGSGKSETSKHKNEGLDEGRSLGRGKSVSNSLEKLGQERTKALLASLLNKFSGQTTNLGGGVVLNRRTQQSVDDVQANLETRATVGILPGKNLLNLALVGLHEQTVQLGESSCHKARRQRLRSVLRKDSQQLNGHLKTALGNQHCDLEVASAKLGKHEEKIDGLHFVGEGNASVQCDSSAERLRERNEKLIRIFHITGVLAVHVALYSIDDGNLSVRGHLTSIDQPLKGLDAGNLNNLGLFLSNRCNHAIQKLSGSLVRSAKNASNEITSSSEKRLVSSVDGIVNQYKIGMGNFLGDWLFHVLEVADQHDEKVECRLLVTPIRSSIGEEWLRLPKQAFYGLLVEPLAHLDQQITSSSSCSDKEIQCVWEVVGILESPLGILLDVKLFMRGLQGGKLLPHRTEEYSALGLSALIESDFGEGLGNILGHGKELVLAQTLFDYVVEQSQGTVELGVGASWDDGKDGRKHVRPLVGKVVDSNLSDCVTGRDLDFAVLLLTQDQVEQNLLELAPDLIGDGDLRLIVKLIIAPVVLDKESQVGKCRLTNVCFNRGMGRDVGEG